MATDIDALRRSKACAAAHALLDDIEPILELTNSHVGDDADDLLKTRLAQAHVLIDELSSGTVPKEYPFNNDDLFTMRDVRESLLKNYMKTILNQFGMWAIVDLTWTKELANFLGDRRVLEVMAGVGWLAKALKEHGIDVVATDDASWQDCHTLAQGGQTVTEVGKLDALDAVKANPQAEVLVVSWPAYKDRAIVDVCDEWGCERPIIYIGESSGGCTACAEFFDHFEAESLGISMPRHAGLYDSVSVGYWHRRKTTQDVVVG